ncbi:hypothetical protein AGABI1DRAFT_133482 [Agaricus bisporus var. burnettii JB137-S8]|uniref:Uncharacterized protein n=1 Tax=Agaricus bisporus var. burnettii (strain JB137-S8 / ATCC MYA-4627 / FGSC 10392) TaxID=597362 RepID=K5XIF4_AGABU|nr:uncharacterized protein AGABI1DRAFT_133482 [Agaricus bisporus var. burnettii JB137-S8]EKM74230.1 hypothetical protein AGABI1DRAFT_133482 [Agaricus bisporus var. burnettii JB137-S8]
MPSGILLSSDQSLSSPAASTSIAEEEGSATGSRSDGDISTGSGSPGSDIPLRASALGAYSSPSSHLRVSARNLIVGATELLGLQRLTRLASAHLTSDAAHHAADILKARKAHTHELHQENGFFLNRSYCNWS